MKPGQQIEVQEAFEIKSVKRVVSLDERNVYVCTDREFKAASVENREPISVGFRKEYVLRVIN